MKIKKLVSMLLVVMMLATLMVGCTKKEDPKPQDPSTPGTEQGGDNKNNEEIVTLKWIQVGGGMPSNYDAWQKNINAYLAKEIGVNIDVEVVSWGDWGNRRSVIVNTNEPFDILFTDLSNYVSDINVGGFLDITDLIPTAAPELYKYIPANYWDAAKVDGKIYSVPTYKDSSATQFIVWDTAMAEKYDIDYQNINTLEGMTEGLTKIKAGENTNPFILTVDGLDSVYSVYDLMSAGLPALGVKYDDQTRTVVNVFEQEDVLAKLETLHQWYKDGIINADAATLRENPSYRSAFVAQGWKLAAKTTWGPQMGVEAEAIQMGDTIVSNDTVRGSLSAISSSSKHPEKALEFLQLVNLDSYVRDAFYYGLEGDNFEYVDGRVSKLNTDWTMAGYTQGTFFTVSNLVDEEFNQWEEVKKLNENAKSSVLLGFSLDTSSIENELANCREVYMRYKSELLTGTKEPKALIATMTQELKTAGFDRIVEEAQNQINESFK